MILVEIIRNYIPTPYPIEIYKDNTNYYIDSMDMEEPEKLCSMTDDYKDALVDMYF